jgi:hypothetical protein
MFSNLKIEIKLIYPVDVFEWKTFEMLDLVQALVGLAEPIRVMD